MYKKKLCRGILPVAAAIILTGCGDSVKVEMSDAFQALNQAQGMTFVQKDVYQVSDDTRKQYRAFKDEVNDATRIFQNSEEKIKALSSTDLSFITDSKLKEETKSSIQELQSSVQNTESKWQQHIEVMKAQYKPKLNAAQAELDDAQKEYEKFSTYFKDEEAQKEQLQAESKVLENKKDAITSKYTELVHKDIIDLKLPISMRDTYNFSYNSRKIRNGENGVCSPYKELKPIQVTEYCYYLKAPSQDLYGTPSYTEGESLLKKYLLLSNSQKEASKEIKALNVQISNKKIVAENQLGTKSYKLESSLKQANRNLQQQEKLLARELNEYKEEAFKQSLLQTETAKAKQKLMKLLEEKGVSLMSGSAHDSTTDIDADLAVDKEIELSIAVMQYKDSKGEVTSLIKRFDPKVVIDNDLTILFDVMDSKRGVRSAIVPDSPVLARILL